MAIDFGFFESVNDDRLYYSDSFNKYFEGLVSRSGIFKAVDGGLAVTPASGSLAVNIATGKAIIDYHWFKITGDGASLSLMANNTGYSRWDRIIIRCNSNLTGEYDGTGRFYGNYTTSATPARTIELAILPGNPTGNRDSSIIPLDEDESDNDGIYEFLLAEVRVDSGVTSIPATGAISDMRSYILAMVETPDIVTIQNEYRAQFNSLQRQLTEWIANTQNTYDAWYYGLTDKLSVGGYIRQFNKTVTNPVSLIKLDMADYVYDNDDVVIVSLNGLILTTDEYSITVGSDYTTLMLTDTSKITNKDVLSIKILKSNITQQKEGTIMSATGDQYIYVDNIAPSQAFDFKILNPNPNNLNPVIDYTTRNLFFDDEFRETQTSNGVTMERNPDGTYHLYGTYDVQNFPEFETSWIDSRAFSMYPSIFTLSLSGQGDSLAEMCDVTFVFQYAYKVSGEDTYVVVDSQSVYITGDGSKQSVTFPLHGEEYNPTLMAAKFRFILQVHSMDDEYDGNDHVIRSINMTVKPQLEYGNIAHDYYPHGRGSFVYGQSLPVFEDEISFIWPHDDTILRRMQLLYYAMTDGSGDSLRY